MILQLGSAFLGSLGFALILRIKGKQLLYAGIGGMITWLIYLLTYEIVPGLFVPVLISSLFVGFYAEIMARINRAPTTIFLTAAAIPLIPGGKLYYAMYGLVSSDMALFIESGKEALKIAFGIVIGFVIIAIITKYIYRLKR